MRHLFLIFLLALAAPGQKPASEQVSDEWKRTIDLNQVANGDAVEIYHNALDYLFPRELANPGRTSCSLVMRFEPASGIEHQLNVILFHSNKPPFRWTSSIWTFQLESGLSRSLDSAQAASEDYGEAATRFASHVGVTAKHFAGDQGITELMRAPLEHGLSVALSDTIPVGHGDRYQLWAKCSLDQVQVKMTTPPDRALTRWMTDMWTVASALQDKNK
jgi:hypothetical protein